jgi:DNA repair protein RecN (Recombination protein N)
MLVELHVVDLGIVADLSLVLGPGLTAITGETGAGKTLLVEAVELLVGGRADATLVRDGADEARVEGRFVHPETGDETILARVVPRDGRSRAYLDGRLATVGELAEAGRALVDLHGQHANQSLLDPSVQRGALDRHTGEPALEALARYRVARAAVRELDSELDALGGDARARAREIDLLRYQVEEIAAGGLEDPGEDVALEAEELLLADAVAHRESLTRAYEALEGPALDAVGTALAALDGRAPFAALAARLRGAQGDLADIEQELRHEVERVDDDPERVDVVRARRHQLHELSRKYGSTLADVIAYGAESAARLDELERYEERAADLEARRAARGRAADAAAAELSEARRAGAGPLGDAVSVHLRELAMPHATLTVDVGPGAATDDGHDAVQYLLAANPGERARPLAKAASGGELSRAMLAARVVLSEAPPTLVFDEVDAGIGGEAGASVGRLLQELGHRHQVLCVTHLAQVAAFAGTQVVVEKSVERVGRGERTVAHAAAVEGDARVAELSRMLAGLGDSSHARRHAAELLATASGGAARGPARGPARGRR